MLFSWSVQGILTLHCRWLYLFYSYVAKTEDKTAEFTGLKPGAEYTVTIQTAVGSGDSEVLSQPQTAQMRTSKFFPLVYME